MMARWFMMMLLLLLSSLVQSDATHHVRNTLHNFHEMEQIPGISVAWITSEGQLYTSVVGMADEERQVLLSPASRMLAASIGKSFVAAAVLDAVQQQELDLDIPVVRWLGHYSWFSRLPNAEQITLRQLLTHTAGLPDHVHIPEFAEIFVTSLQTGMPLTAEMLVALVLDMPPLFLPGEGWSYSDTGYLLVGMVLEKHYGEPWAEKIMDTFIEPLRLEDTSPSDQIMLEKLAVGYADSSSFLGLPKRTLDESGALVWHPATEGAGGGFVSNASDLARWGKALWSGSLFSPEVFDEMLTGVSISTADQTIRYGLGVVMEQTSDYGAVRRHSGWIPGYVSSLRYYPEHDLAIAIQVNTDIGMMGREGVFHELERTLVEAIMESSSAALN